MAVAEGISEAGVRRTWHGHGHRLSQPPAAAAKNSRFSLRVCHRSANRESGQQIPEEQQVWLEQDFLNKASWRARGREDVILSRGSLKESIPLGH
jgi:hypothetical protein